MSRHKPGFIVLMRTNVGEGSILALVNENDVLIEFTTEDEAHEAASMNPYCSAMGYQVAELEI